MIVKPDERRAEQAELDQQARHEEAVRVVRRDAEGAAWRDLGQQRPEERQVQDRLDQADDDPGWVSQRQLQLPAGRSAPVSLKNVERARRGTARRRSRWPGHCGCGRSHGFWLRSSEAVMSRSAPASARERAVARRRRSAPVSPGRRCRLARRSGRRRIVAQRPAGQGQEHVVQRRPGELDGLHRDALAASSARSMPGRASSPCSTVILIALPSTAISRTPGWSARIACARPGSALTAERDHVTGDPALQLVGHALGDDLAVVDHEHPVAERVGLLQVVRGQEDRGAETLAQPADVIPQVAAALRVEPGGRLVEEYHGRGVDQAERDVQPAALAARQRLAEPGLQAGELELAGQQRRSLGRLRRRQPVDPALDRQFLADRGSSGRCRRR